MEDAPLLPPSPASRRRGKSKAALRREASYIFKYLLFAQVTVYLETGTIPCLLDAFAAVFDMNAREQGWLGSVVYIALCAASPLSAIAYKHVDAKIVLGVSLVLNNLCVLGFAMTPTGYESSSLMLITMRALIGFTQSFLCVYTPLWVDAFSPRGSVAGWMSYLQGSVPLGVMFGYLFGSVSNWVSIDECYIQCWRWPFLLQFVLVLPLMVGVFFIPSEHLSIRHAKKHTPANDTHPVVLEEMVRGTRRSLSNLSYSFRDLDLNPAQFTAIRASYTTPRFRMDAYDIESLFLDEPDENSTMSPSTYGSIPSAHPPVSIESTYHTALSHIDSSDGKTTSSTRGSLDLMPLFISEELSPLNEVDSALTSSYALQAAAPLSRHSHRLNELDEEEDEDDDEVEDDAHLDDLDIVQSFIVLLTRPLFTLIVLGLSAIYFVVTGVQFWSTIYLQKNFDASVVIVNGLFVVVAGTGPIWGVFFGGALIDRAGGYMGLRQRAKALGICVGLGFVAFALGVVTTFLPSLYLQATSLWLLLFFGGAILPSCTGIFISATPIQLRSLASSISVMVFNLLGYALAPALTGSFMELIHNYHEDPTSYWFGCDEACMYRVGFRCCLAWSVWSLLAMLAAYMVAKQQASKSTHEESVAEQGEIVVMMH
ncbi:hypothetical protein LEN26_009066 [Aphanomyces euteiches]|nr:hypothetical protein AeMF1_021399 [Aphanomyces euteiches]KAH9128825.1 hypothetical protein LEN26_009066 [Aphanomyces euteiches]KAH9185256.1 hypothetical protein AeNC1_012768 [Aphanomyces euteiches]